MKTLFSYFLKFTLILFIFTGCGKEEELATYVPSYTPSIQEDSNQTPQLLEPLRAPSFTSFSEDLVYYDIGDSNDTQTQALQRANGYEEEKEEGEEESGEDEDSDEDDAEDKSDGDDDDDEESSDDEEEEESSDDDSDDDSSSSSSSTQPVYDHMRLGGFNLSLNTKNYQFVVVHDKFNRVPDPLFEKQLNGEYIITISGYILEEDTIIYADGVFTLQIKVPSLNLDNMPFPISSNILTNSATTESVTALVTISQVNEGGKILLNIVVPEFQVYNRSKDRAYNATFSVGLETN